MTITYNPRVSFMRVLLLQCKGSAVPGVLRSIFFWVQICIFLLLLAIDRAVPSCTFSVVVSDCAELSSGEDGGDGENPVTGALPVLHWSATATVVALLTFFIVFYSSQTYARLQMFWENCFALSGLTMDWAATCRNHVPSEYDIQWNSTRLILASSHLLYYTLNQSSGGASIDEDEWGHIKERHLLTPVEIELVKVYKGYQPQLPILWALRELSTALSDPNTQKMPARDGHLMQEFRELAREFRMHCGTITSQLDHPVPFPYYHMLVLQLFLGLMSMAWGLVTLRFHPVLTIIIYSLLSLVFLGMKDVAVQMSDPFGDDETDFPIESMLQASYDNAMAILNDPWQSSKEEDQARLANQQQAEAAAATAHGASASSSAAAAPNGTRENGHGGDDETNGGALPPSPLRRKLTKRQFPPDPQSAAASFVKRLSCQGSKADRLFISRQASSAALKAGGMGVAQQSPPVIQSRLLAPAASSMSPSPMRRTQSKTSFAPSVV